MTMPAWMNKHPCTGCQTGYGACAQGLAFSLMCCASCDHPTRWTPGSYTPEEIAEMWRDHRCTLDAPPLATPEDQP